MVLFYSPPKKKVTKAPIVTVKVTGIDSFGQGIAHYNGKTLFIKNALPDEEVDIKIIDDKKQYAKGNVVKYHQRSTKRIEPKCDYHGRCGGCQMQHIPISQQHEIKKQALTNLFKKEANHSLCDDDILVVHASPYHYRRRARLAILFEKNRLFVGFRQQESNQIIDITHCPILTKELSQLLSPLRDCLQQIKNKRALGHAELIHVDSGIILIIRHILPLNNEDKQKLTDFSKTNDIDIYLNGESLVCLSKEKQHYYCIEDLKLTFSPLDFIQVNADINLKMVNQAKDWLSVNQNDRILDLFCGMGNFTLPLATKCQQITGVEGVENLVNKATENANLNKNNLINQPIFFISDLDDSKQNKNWDSIAIDKVLLDPARAGAFAVIEKIIQYQPSHIVYISCNPATLVRDSKKLLQSGYAIEKISILDMFPQTKHIESMLLFTKTGAK